MEQKGNIGYWIEGKYTDDDIRYNDTSYKCSECKKIVPIKYPYCPYCANKKANPLSTEL